jgi:hypothetical protein
MTSGSPKDAPVPSDRRKFGRRKFMGTLEIEWGSSMLVGVVRDIGPNGLFVLMTQPLWIGATFSARLMLNPPLPLKCTVRRVEPGTGIGVTFDTLDERTNAQLQELFVKLPQV